MKSLILLTILILINSVFAAEEPPVNVVIGEEYFIGKNDSKLSKCKVSLTTVDVQEQIGDFNVVGTSRTLIHFKGSSPMMIYNFKYEDIKTAEELAMLKTSLAISVTHHDDDTLAITFEDLGNPNIEGKTVRGHFGQEVSLEIPDRNLKVSCIN